MGTEALQEPGYTLGCSHPGQNHAEIFYTCRIIHQPVSHFPQLCEISYRLITAQHEMNWHWHRASPVTSLTIMHCARHAFISVSAALMKH